MGPKKKNEVYVFLFFFVFLALGSALKMLIKKIIKMSDADISYITSYLCEV